jgi:hypothetical protein
VLIVLKSGRLSRLEHSGPVKAYNGIALPLPLPASKAFDHALFKVLETISLGRSWLRHCVISRKFAFSIPDVTGVLHWHNPSGRTMYGPGNDSASNRS